MRVAIYTRLSKDPTGAQTATARQENACRAFADLRGWMVVGTYEDVDRSAYLPNTHRPEFERLLADAKRGRFDGILVWKLDRLVRRPFQFERLWDTADRASCFVASATEPIDTSSEIGVALLRILVAVASFESATTGFRVAAKKRETAERGTPPPTKAFGWNEEWTELVEEEASLLREAATRVLDGERVASVARDWRMRGIPAPRGGHWTDATLGRMLRSPRLVGDRTYRGEVVAQNCWPAILDRETSTRLQLTLSHPDRVGAGRKHSPRLATGLATCARCGQRMMTTTRSGVRYYSCPTVPTGCGRTHVKAEALEEFLIGQMINHLQAHRLEPASVQLMPEEIARRQRELATDFYARAVITRDEFLAARDELTRQTDAALGDQHAPERLRALLGGRRTLPRAVRALEPTHKRELARLVLVKVLVDPALPESKGRFDGRRIRLCWHDDLADPA